MGPALPASLLTDVLVFAKEEETTIKDKAEYQAFRFPN